MRQAEITIPYAIADFAILREGGYYYVDKTRYIPLLEETGQIKLLDFYVMEKACEFLEELGRTRPRLATAFAHMTVSGNRIGVTVSTELLRDDIVQRQKELGARLRELAGLNGGVEFDIEVREDHSAVRPIKPEDKLAHLRNKNAQLDLLRRELDLEME